MLKKTKLQHIFSNFVRRVSTLRVSTPQGSTPRVLTPQGSTPQGSTPQDSTPQGSTPQGSTPQGSTPRVSTTLVLIATFAFSLLAILLAFYIFLPSIANKYLLSSLEQNLGKKVSIERISRNFFIPNRLTFENLRIYDEGKTEENIIEDLDVSIRLRLLSLLSGRIELVSKFIGGKIIFKQTYFNNLNNLFSPPGKSNINVLLPVRLDFMRNNVYLCSFDLSECSDFYIKDFSVFLKDQRAIGEVSFADSLFSIEADMDEEFSSRIEIKNIDSGEALRGNIHIQEDMISFDDLSLSLESLSLAASGEIKYNQDYLQGRLDLQRFELLDIQELIALASIFSSPTFVSFEEEGFTGIDIKLTSPLISYKSQGIKDVDVSFTHKRNRSDKISISARLPFEGFLKLDFSMNTNATSTKPFFIKGNYNLASVSAGQLIDWLAFEFFSEAFASSGQIIPLKTLKIAGNFNYQDQILSLSKVKMVLEENNFYAPFFNIKTFPRVYLEGNIKSDELILNDIYSGGGASIFPSFLAVDSNIEFAASKLRLEQAILHDFKFWTAIKDEQAEYNIAAKIGKKGYILIEGNMSAGEHEFSFRSASEDFNSLFSENLSTSSIPVKIDVNFMDNQKTSKLAGDLFLYKEKIGLSVEFTDKAIKSSFTGGRVQIEDVAPVLASLGEGLGRFTQASAPAPEARSIQIDYIPSYMGFNDWQLSDPSLSIIRDKKGQISSFLKGRLEEAYINIKSVMGVSQDIDINIDLKGLDIRSFSGIILDEETIASGFLSAKIDLSLTDIFSQHKGVKDLAASGKFVISDLGIIGVDLLAASKALRHEDRQLVFDKFSVALSGGKSLFKQIYADFSLAKGAMASKDIMIEANFGKGKANLMFDFLKDRLYLSASFRLFSDIKDLPAFRLRLEGDMNSPNQFLDSNPLAFLAKRAALKDQ